jgi:hypothetical protein
MFDVDTDLFRTVLNKISSSLMAVILFPAPTCDKVDGGEFRTDGMKLM